jgi:hypothetical protein
MALGRPAIPNLAKLELLRLQQIVNNIRERFGATDAAINDLADSDTASSLARDREITNLQSQIDELRQLIEDIDTSNTHTITLTAAEDIADAGIPLFVSADGEASQTDPDALALQGYVGISVAGASQGDPIEVRLPGGVVLVESASYTTGRPLYAQLGGTTHFPAGNSLPVGIAISATEISVGYGFNVLGDDTFDPTGQDDMAVTKGLAGDGTGGVLPVVTGEILNAQPVFVYLDDGSLVYSPAPAYP